MADVEKLLCAKMTIKKSIRGRDCVSTCIGHAEQTRLTTFSRPQFSFAFSGRWSGYGVTRGSQSSLAAYGRQWLSSGHTRLFVPSTIIVIFFSLLMSNYIAQKICKAEKQLFLSSQTELFN